MISLEKALQIVLSEVSKIRLLPPEEVGILSSLSRTLAEDVYAHFNIPGFDRAAMDGYALVAQDTSSAALDRPSLLEVIADLPAGYRTDKVVDKGKAIRIMTGAPLPEGADAVIMVEDTETEENKVKVFKKVKIGENISFAGEDVKKEELILPGGKFIRAAEVGMLASLGKKKILVRRKPRIAIVSTGDELVETGKNLGKGKVYDSNSFALFSQVVLSGGEPQRLGIVQDKREDLMAKIREGLSFDILILSGGVSMGEYDLVKEAMENTGVKMLFWRVAVKPGKPTFFGVRGNTLVFGLPGYPVSSMINFENMVRPAIFSMLGRKDWQRIKVRAILKGTVKKKGKRKNFIRVKLLREGGKYWALPAPSQKSGVLKSMVWANGLLILPGEVERIEKGKEVLVELLG
ncbi:molybdopterin molybdotransferase MoeA [Candidatus Aerophobetes bacterium]|nr:molybdopterin molybdotransferase MoeA [Candidatus Aerophobetes bacterium]